MILYLNNSSSNKKRASNGSPSGNQILGIERKGVLSNVVERMLVGNRVRVGLTRALPSKANPTDQEGYFSQAQ